MQDKFRELKELVDAMAGLATATEKALADKRITLADYRFFIAPLLALPDAIQGLSEAVKEWAGAGPGERAGLIRYFSRRFDLANDQAEALIERAVSIGTAIYELVNDVFYRGKSAHSPQ